MVETMALIHDTVGFTFVKTSKSQVRDGVTISEVCAELMLSAVKEIEEAAFEFGPIDSGGAAIPKVGLFGLKYGKGRGDDPWLLEEGSVKRVCKIAKGKLVERYSV